MPISFVLADIDDYILTLKLILEDNFDLKLS